MIQAMADGCVKMGLPCYVMVLNTLPLCCVSGFRYDTGDG